jgi:GntR family transcriptional regulator
VPIHEQISTQLMAHVASGDLLPGAKLAEYRAFAQQLLTNPNVVARAYDDLEVDGVLKKDAAGGMEVAVGAAVICRVRLQDMAGQRIRQAVMQGLAWGLPEGEVQKAVEQALTAARAQALSAEELLQGIKKSTHATSHRASQGIQVLSGQKGPGSSQPDRPGGSDFRAAR